MTERSISLRFFFPTSLVTMPNTRSGNAKSSLENIALQYVFGMSIILVTPLSVWALAAAPANVSARSAIQTMALDLAAIAAMQTVIAMGFLLGEGYLGGLILPHPLW